MKILLASDGSPHSEAAVDFIGRFPLPPGAEVTLLTVVESFRPVFGAEHPIIGKEVSAAFDELRMKLRKVADQLLERETTRLRGLSKALGVHLAIREGHVPGQILETCHDGHFDLLVTGCRGLGGFKELLLGSVSQQLVKHAPCSVLIVKPQREPRHIGAPDPTPPDSNLNSRLKILFAFDNSLHSSAAAELLDSLPLKDRTEVTMITVVPELSRYGLQGSAIRLLTEVWEQERQEAIAAAERAAWR